MNEQAYAGAEEVVREQVATALAESKPLPEWQTTSTPPKPTDTEQRDTIRLTPKADVQAWTYSARVWYASLFIRLSDQRGEYPTADARLAILHEALAEIDTARAALVELLEAAKGAKAC